MMWTFNQIFLWNKTRMISALSCHFQRKQTLLLSEETPASSPVVCLKLGYVGKDRKGRKDED